MSNIISITKGRGNQTLLGSSQAYLTDSVLPAGLAVSYADVKDSPPLSLANKHLSLQEGHEPCRAGEANAAKCSYL
jgi:hypothetical protein